MELLQTLEDENIKTYRVHVYCAGNVANKVEKFFKRIRRANVKVHDLYIREYPTYSGYESGTQGGKYIVLCDCTEEFLYTANRYIPMMSWIETTESTLPENRAPKSAW